MPQATDRLTAALGDRYRIVRLLGQGGMASVYLAADLKHDRQVAIKVLKPELAAVLGAERFVQEIKTTAALSHPHILPLFDSGEAGGFLYYVMPYIEGETIRERLNRETQLGIDEAVRITTEVADALDYAHRHGVIHRDIKPENILLHDGRPMVMDFGIALAVSAAAGGRMTETGLSLGTPHYMSPEQATADKQITARSDIYSLASVLYEMLAGSPPHTGSTAQQIIMKIIAESAAPVTQFRKSVPEHVAGAIAQALEKVPADRFATAAEFSSAIQGLVAVRGQRAGAATSKAERAAPSRVHRETVLGAVAVVSLAVAAWALATRGGPTPSAGPVEFAFRMGPGIPDRPYIDISDDGRRILMVVRDSLSDGGLAVRDLGSTAVTRLAGPSEVQNATFSPDGRWIGYATRSKLMRIPSGGGPATQIADSVNGTMAWVGSDELVVSRQYGGLFRVSVNGGPATALTTLDTTRREFAHWSPSLLPGGKVVLFNNFSTPLANSRIEALELATGRRTVLVEAAVEPRYAPTGHLLFVREGALYAVRFDPRTLEVSGTAVPVVEDVAWAFTDGTGGYSLANDGTLVYLKESEWNVDSRVMWVDRQGNARPAIDGTGAWAEPRMSPDGRWIALTRRGGDRKVWLYDRGRRVMTQLTRTAGVAFNAIWAPDSRSLAVSVETPSYDLWRFSLDGSQTDTLLATSTDKFASGFSPDGRLLLFHGAGSGERIEAIPMPGGAPTTLLEAGARTRHAVVSPDGRWIAYMAIARGTGEHEVFVTRLAGGGGRRQVSSGGGTEPLWTKGGRELVYRNGAAVMAVPFDPASGEPGTPARLFAKSDMGRVGAGASRGYDVSPDGSQFLMVLPVDRPDALPVVVITRWLDELERKVPR